MLLNKTHWRIRHSKCRGERNWVLPATSYRKQPLLVVGRQVIVLLLVWQSPHDISQSLRCKSISRTKWIAAVHLSEIKVLWKQRNRSKAQKSILAFSWFPYFSFLWESSCKYSPQYQICSFVNISACKDITSTPSAHLAKSHFPVCSYISILILISRVFQWSRGDSKLPTTLEKGKVTERQQEKPVKQKEVRGEIWEEDGSRQKKSDPRKPQEAARGRIERQGKAECWLKKLRPKYPHYQ